MTLYLNVVFCDNALYGIGNSLFSVIHRYDHACLYVKLLFVKVRLMRVVSIDKCAETAKMCRGHFFHFNLYVPVCRAHVVELFLTAGAQVYFTSGIQIFIKMQYTARTTGKKSGSLYHAA